MKCFTAILFVLFFNTLSGQHKVKSKHIYHYDSIANEAFKNKDFEDYFKNFTVYENLLEKCDSTAFIIRSQYLHARNFFDIGMYHQSKELAKNAISFDDDITNVTNPIFTSLNYVLLAKSQNALKEYENAKNTYRKAITLAKRITPTKRPIRLASAYNNLGLQYLNYEINKDSALWCFQLAKKIMKESELTDENFYGTINENIAHIEFNERKYTVAKELYLNNYNQVFELNHSNHRIKRNHLLSGINLSKTYLKLNEFQRAEDLLKEIKVNLDNLDDFYFKDQVYILWIETSIDLEENQKNYKKALSLSKELEKIKDELKNKEIETQNLGNVILTANKTEQLQTMLENERLKLINTQQKNRTRFWLVISILLILLGVFIFLYSQYKQRLAITNKNKELAEQKALAQSYKNQLLTKNLKNKTEDITNLALSSEQNLNWLEELEKTVSVYQKNNNLKTEEFLKELQESIENKKRLNLFTENLNKKIATINSEFYSKLRNQHPELTEYEIKLCTLIRINLESKDIATILNISPASVNTSRYRLRKKLNLEKKENLTSYLKAI